MTDADTLSQVGDAPAPAGQTFQIPITKAGNETIEVNTSWFNDDVYNAIFAEGLKALLNKGPGASKLTKAAYPKADEMKAKAIEIASAQLTLMREGQLKSRKAKAKGVDREVTTEAMRLAKAAVKDMLKAAGKKPSQIESKVITQAAKELLEQDDEYLSQAKTNVEARRKATESTLKAMPSSLKETIAAIPVSAKLKAKAEKAAAERKSQLSAKQAGKVQPRAKGKGGAPAHA